MHTESGNRISGREENALLSKILNYFTGSRDPRIRVVELPSINLSCGRFELGYLERQKKKWGDNYKLFVCHTVTYEYT